MIPNPVELLGLPLDEVKAQLEQNGLEVQIVPYKAKRDLEGADDLRVLRCRIDGRQAVLVVSAFCTVF